MMVPTTSYSQPGHFAQRTSGQLLSRKPDESSTIRAPQLLMLLDTVLNISPGNWKAVKRTALWWQKS